MAPSQHRQGSRQDWGTPRGFLTAVQLRFGPISFDLAASPQNAVVKGRFYGPGSGANQDALEDDARPWAMRLEAERGASWLWLNPPFADIDRWATACATEMQRGARILLLTPASVGTRWYAQHIVPHAHVLFLSPRLTFVGARDPYPKDLMLSVFAHGLTGCSTWQWAAGRARKAVA